MLPQYPVYVPSKGRYAYCETAQCLIRDEVPFFLVVQPQEAEQYGARFGKERLLLLPPGLDGLVPTRNWILAHAREAGARRHWQIDDNCRRFRRLFQGRRVPCRAGIALRVCEEFSDRYENVAVSGLSYQMFVVPDHKTGKPVRPFYLNHHVYSISLVNNETPFCWRGVYNDDVDLCLQALSTGWWCTVQLNVFMAAKGQTMKIKGGNTDIYEGDGRAKMAAEIVARWPQYCKITTKWGRPQHHVYWEKFKQPLIRRKDIDWDALAAGGDNEFGMVRRNVKTGEILS